MPRELIAECIAAAGTAPSGANQQPWHFAAVSDPDVKRRIRVAAEDEERRFYEQRATDEWLAALHYPTESVGIASGVLITALHAAGLATLTHTPSPMGFLNDILGRAADSERPFLLLVVGYPAPETRVPAIDRQPLTVISSWFEAR